MVSNGRIALVTGGGSGIGRAASLALQAAGYSVVIAGRRLAELEKTVAMAGPSGGRMLAVSADVSRPESFNALFARIAEEFVRLDVLFNNAGLNAPGIPIEELTFETWSALVNVNPIDGSFQSQVDIKDGVSFQPVVANNTLYLLTDGGRLIAYR